MRNPPSFVPREARVHREYAHLYDGWEVRTWAPAAKVAELLRAKRANGHMPEARPRLPEEEFEFRGGAPRRPGLIARTRRSD